jgi:hypothetical protein
MDLSQTLRNATKPSPPSIQQRNLNRLQLTQSTLHPHPWLPIPAKTTKIHNLKIMQYNINGIQNKLHELKQFLTDENIDVAAIQ